MFVLSLNGGFGSVCAPSLELARDRLAQAVPGARIGRIVAGAAPIYAGDIQVGVVHEDIVLSGSLELGDRPEQIQATEPTYTIRDSAGVVRQTRVSAIGARSYVQTAGNLGDRLEIIAEDSTVVLAAPVSLDSLPFVAMDRPAPTGPQADKARELSTALDQVGVNVEWEPDTYTDDDQEGSRGHFFTAKVPVELSDDSELYLLLDDRRDMSLRRQIAVGLENVAEELREKAEGIDPNGTSGRAAA